MWDKVLYFAKWIVGVGAFVTFSISIYQYFNDVKDSGNINQKEIMVYLREITDSSRIQHSILNKKLDAITDKQDEMIINENIMKKSIINHVAKDKAVTKDDLYRFIQEIGSELKKNNITYQPTRLFLTHEPSPFIQ